MSEAPQGPGWWQASDFKWYPPERQSNYVAPPPPPPRQPPPPGYHNPGAGHAPYMPPGPPHQAHPGYPQYQAAGGQRPSDGLAAAKDIAAKFSVATWLLVGGFVFAVIASFLPWATVNAIIINVSVPLPGATKVAVFLIVAGATWLAWPIFSGSQMPVNRLIGLSVVAGLLIFPFLQGLYGVFFNDYESEHVDVSPGFGLLLYAVALVAIGVGILRLWQGRSTTRGQAF
jgi:hypothetical protein